MECEKARDRFSSLVEGELPPAEEKELRDHLSVCSECQRDFLRFEKTIDWLHSVEEVEVPRGFLAEIHEKLEERKQGGALAKKTGWGFFPHSPRVKLPIQAVAMVAVLFLVIYVTKMIPVETSHKKATPYPESSLSEEKKVEPGQFPSATTDLKGPEKPEAPVASEERADQRIASKQGEAEKEKDLRKPAVPLPLKDLDENGLALKESKGETAPPPKAGVLRPADVLRPAEQPILGKKGEATEVNKGFKEPETSPPEKEGERAVVARKELKGEEKAGAFSREAQRSEGVPIPGKPLFARQERGKVSAPKEGIGSPPSPPVREVVLKISDRDKFLTQLYGLVGEFGGDVAQMEENMIVASVPAGSLLRFEKELGLLSRTKEPPSPKQTPMGKLSSVRIVKGKEAKEEDKDVKARDSDKDDRVSIRIRLIQE